MDNIDEIPREEREEQIILDSIPRDNIYMIGKRRQRSVYYRKDGTPTKPLPSDALGKMHYLGKGLSLKPKVDEEKIEVSGIRCPYCGFEPKNARSLRTHLSKHVDNNDKGE